MISTASNVTNVETNLVPLEDEWPVSTLIAFWFIISYIFLIIIVKTITEWSELMRVNPNKFDLIIYKSAIEQKPIMSNGGAFVGTNQSTTRDEKRLFDNSAIRLHNLKAFSQSGFQLSSLDKLN